MDEPEDIWMDCNDKFNEVIPEKLNSVIVCDELSSCDTGSICASVDGN